MFKKEVPFQWLFLKTHGIRSDFTNSELEAHLQILSDHGIITYTSVDFSLPPNMKIETLNAVLKTHLSDEIIGLIRKPQADRHIFSIKHETAVVVLSNQIMCKFHRFYPSLQTVESDIIGLRVKVKDRINQETPEVISAREILEPLGLIVFKDGQWIAPVLTKFSLTNGPENKVISTVRFE